MNKPTAARPTSLGRIRSLLAFRHQNPIARFVSTLLAFAIATLLVVGSGAAYADDTAPTDTSTSASSSDGTDPATGQTADPASGDSTAPAADSTDTPADVAPPSDPAATDSTTADTKGSGSTSGTPTGKHTVMSTLTKLASPTPNLVGNAACQNTPNTMVGGFEIDGDPCADEGGIDFNGGCPAPPAEPGCPGDSTDDGYGDNGNWFTQGSSENDNPATWKLTGNSNTGKADIGTAWAWSHTWHAPAPGDATDGHVFAYFGFTNDSTAGGTQDYSLEYNQADPVNGKPVRTPGDLLFHFFANGNVALTYEASYIYTEDYPNFAADGCVESGNLGAGWCPFELDPADFVSAASPTGEYVEGSIDITNLFGAGNCSGTFGTTFLRSAPGSFFTSELKDYVAPLDVTTPSTCGEIVINKTDADTGALVGGAVFSIHGDPRPGGDATKTYCVYDGPDATKPAKPAGCDIYVADGTADGIITIDPVEPGTYTVTELVPPPGYLLNPEPTPGNSKSVTVGESETKTLVFSNHKIWKGLTATKTADPTYHATYHWGIDKEISPNGTDGWTTDTTSGAPLVKKVTAGSPDTLFYRVTVTEGARTTDLYKVSGKITVSNPADNVGSMDAVVTDSLPGATCLVDGGASKPVTVAAGASVEVPYVCTFAGTPTADQLSGTNTGKVEWDRSTYPQVVGDLTDVGGATRKVEPTAVYDFAKAVVTEVDKTVTVTDNKHTFVPAWTITYGDDNTTADGDGVGVYTSAVYSQTVSAAPGSCSSVFANTATVTGNTTGVLDSDSAYGKVCEGADLTITRIDARGFTRTYPWSIEKATTTPKITVSGGKATGSYDVTVTAGDGVDGPTWSMTGTITVHNPNDWEAVSVTSLPITYSGGGTCAVTGEVFPVSIAAGGQHAFAYSCDFGNPAVQPSYSGNISATANWNAATAVTPNDHVTDSLSITEADWTKTLVNDTVTVVDDHATPGDSSDDTEWTLDWATVHGAANQQTVLHYTIDLPIPDGGTCDVDTNTVKILGDGDVALDADGNLENNSADVQVCNPLGLSLTKTAVGDFTRTYPWTLEKFIGPDRDQSSETVHIDGYDHTFNYRVKATPGTAVDSAWTVSGTITVHNDNTDTDIDPITVTSISDLPDIDSAGSCTLDKAVPFDVASGDDEFVNYECTFAQKPSDNSGGELPTYGGTNSASVGWGASGSASTGDVDVDWNTPTEVGKSLPIWDDKVNLPDAEQIGTAVWNAAHTPTIVDYTKNLTVPESTQGSCAPAQTNTAWLGGDGSEPTQLQDSTDAIICVKSGTWEVSKVNIHGDGPVPTDSDVTYRLTAHKTSEVNPKNVVLYDDLSDIAPYVDLPTQAELEAAAPAGSTATITGNLITWTIDELGATDQTLDFTVHVHADANNVDLPNLVTSPGSDNCVDDDITTAADECKTDNLTPHYTLEKTSDADPQVLPPYLGQPGTLITYTLTVHNDSAAPINSTTMPGEQVTDDLSDVLDNATWVGNITPDGQAVFDGDHTLTWTLPEIAANGHAGDTVTLTYQVRVAGDQWDQTLTNVAHHGPGGNCVPVAALVVAPVEDNANCTTTTVTPPYAQIQALKVDAETQAPLSGAQFSLYLGTEQTEANLLDTATSGADGVALFDTKLQPGVFTVVETAAPDGYDLPSGEGAVQQVTVTADDLDNGEVPVGVTFGDPPQGALAIAKAHYERNAAGTGWVPSDGQVDFGDEIRYVMTVTATGPKVFHDVEVTDYVPGWNPADHTTAPAGTKAVLESASISCGGAFTCTTDPVVNGKITWHVTSTGQETGDVTGDVVGTVEFVVRMPNIPAANQTPGTSYAAILWNQATLWWTAFGEEAPDTHSLLSNTVTDAANATLPPEVKPPEVKPPSALPNTGGPDSRLLIAGLVLLLGGGIVVAGDRRRRRRS